MLNDPHVWISPGDKYASKIIKETICWFDPNEGKVVGGTPWGGNMPFDGPNNNLFSGDSGDVLISYCFIAHGPVSNIPLATTPLAFTRGLCIDGTWDEKSGLYGSKGGFVVFCDGHTNWFDDSKPAKFLHWNGQKYTSDIREAVPLNSEITCCSKSEIYKGNNTKLIIYDFGQG
jgi:hypothetical protein